MAFIEEITPEQESQLPNYREAWQRLVFSTERIDHQQATKAVQAVYNLLELPTPEINFFDSPYLAAVIAKPLYERPYFTEDGFGHGTKLIAKLHEKFYFDNRNAIGHWDDLIEFQLKTNAYSEIIDWQLSASLKDDPLGGKFKESQYIYYFLPLNWYANEGGFFDFHFSIANHTLFQPYDEYAWKVFQELVKSCGWIIPFENICLVCARPTKFSFDSENRLHAEGNPAVQFADGYGLYFSHGVGSIPVEEI